MGRRRIKEMAISASAVSADRRSKRDRALAFAVGLGNPRRALALALALVFVAAAALGVVVDLSPADPFGPGLGWSPGLILIATSAVLLLIRGWREG